MKFHWQSLLALYLLSCLAFAGQGKQTPGAVANADGLLKVHTFCLDTSQLTPKQLSNLREFAASADKPKGVFTKLHWQRLDACGSADAMVKVSMEETQGTAPFGDSSNLQDKTQAMKSVQIQRARIVVTNRASGMILYETESGEFTDDREGAYGGAFSRLLKDLKNLRK
jgi:hypothetical protein